MIDAPAGCHFVSLNTSLFGDVGRDPRPKSPQTCRRFRQRCRMVKGTRVAKIFPPNSSARGSLRHLIYLDFFLYWTPRKPVDGINPAGILRLFLCES